MDFSTWDKLFQAELELGAKRLHEDEYVDFARDFWLSKLQRIGGKASIIGSDFYTSVHKTLGLHVHLGKKPDDFSI